MVAGNPIPFCLYPSMEVLAVIQARLSSRRLPGKVLTDLHGRPMIAWLVERLRACRTLSGIVLATSDDASDDPLAAYCAGAGVACRRGPLDDVAGRFLAVGRQMGADAVVRINGDSPLMDPAVVDQAARLWAAGSWDLVTNTQMRSFPKGMSVEVIRLAALERAHPGMTADEREHVTQCFYRRPDDFRIVNFSSGLGLAAVQMSVDTPEDLDLVRRMMRLSDGAAARMGVEELMRLRDRALADA